MIPGGKSVGGRIRLTTLLLSFALAVSFPPNAETILYEQDHNRDGKTDFWFLFEDDVPTTVFFDRDRDGKADIGFVYGNHRGRFDILQIWIDDDLDGALNEFGKRLGDGSWRIWRAGLEHNPGLDYFIRNDPRVILERRFRQAHRGTIPLTEKSRPLGFYDNSDPDDETKVPTTWCFTLHGKLQARISDVAFDRRPESLWLWETIDGRQTTTMWRDIDGDLKYDYLDLKHPNGIHEMWDRASSTISGYLKDDHNTMIRITATTYDLRCRVLTGVKASHLPKP